MARDRRLLFAGVGALALAGGLFAFALWAAPLAFNVSDHVGEAYEPSVAERVAVIGQPLALLLGSGLALAGVACLVVLFARRELDDADG